MARWPYTFPMKTREPLLTLILLLWTGGVLTAQTPAPTTTSAPKDTKVQKEWTVLITLEADNALEPAALATVQKLSLLSPGPTWNLVVEVVRPGTGPKRFQGLKGGLQEVAAPPLGTNPLTAEGLANFVAWGTKAFPAKKTALFFWGQGGGRNGFGFSDATQKTLSLAELQSGLSQGLGAGKRLDLVGFDAARMASYEVAQAVAPSARILLACEGTEVAAGWDWSTLQVLTKTPASTGAQLGAALQASYPAARHPLSLVDLDKLGPIDAALRSIEAAFTPRQAALGTAVGLARNRCEPLGATGDPATDGQVVDLAALAAGWKTTADLSGPAQALEAAALAAILDGQAGLSVWFPATAQAFASADLAGEPASWARFLKAWTPGVGATASAVVSVEQVASGVEVLDGNVSYTRLFDPAALATATRSTLTYGTADSWNVLLFWGQKRAEPSDKAVSAAWNLTGLTLTQDGRPVQAYATEDWVADNQVQYSIPFAYYPDGVVRKEGGQEAVWLAVTVDRARGQVVDQAWFEQTVTGIVGPLVAKKDGRVAVLAMTRSPDGVLALAERGGLFDPSQPVVCTLETLAATGKAVLSLDIGDDAGRSQGQEFIGPLINTSSFQIYRFFSR